MKRHLLIPAIATALLADASMAAKPERTARRGMEPVHQPVVTPDGRAYVPGCPDWSDAAGHPSEAQARNFGCASAENLAAMIADPNDLIRGRTSTGADAESALKAIKAWRTAPPSGAGNQIEKVSSKGGSE